MMDEKKSVRTTTQNIMIENRQKLSISGVVDVESFNEENVVVETNMGMLIVRGEDLHINRLNLDNSELIIEGEIISCEYSDRSSKAGGFFSKLFR